VNVKFNQSMNRKVRHLEIALAILCFSMLGVRHQLLAQQAGESPSPANQPGPASPQAQPTAPQTQPASPQTPTTPAKNSGAKQSQPAPDPNVPHNDRILWTLPNYLTVENASSLPPLTAKEKFKLVAQGTFDPMEFAFLALESGVNQASNTNPTFGQGLKGYGKRYALAFTDNASENFMTGAVFPSMLHQDPRYYQLGKGSFLHRAEYAGMRIFLTRSDSGSTQFNYSEIFGAAVAAGVSNAYHPGPRTLNSNISVWWTQIGWDAVSFELKEFWPDIRRYILHPKHQT
jgi:hypothetical protein